MIPDEFVFLLDLYILHSIFLFFHTSWNYQNIFDMYTDNC